jgi:hypothetical protein
MTVLLKTPVNIGDFAGWWMGLVVEVGKEPVKRAFSRRA